MRLPERGAIATPDSLTRLVRQAEKHGFYAVEFGDHFLRPLSIKARYPDSETGVPPVWHDWLEQLTTLSFLAAKTTKLRLVAGVMVLPYRNPLISAKMMTTIDVLSKGRIICGVGSGWLKEEFDALGAPPFHERGDVSDEYIKAFKELWSNEIPEFHGNYFSVSGVRLLPKPVQKPHPPIWVGGETPRAMKRAAFLGDCWYPICTNPRYPLLTFNQIQAAMTQLSDYASEAGKGRVEVALEVQHSKFDGRSDASSPLFVGAPEKVANDIKQCERLGICYIGFDLRTQEFDGTLANYAEFAESVMPKLNNR